MVVVLFLFSTIIFSLEVDEGVGEIEISFVGKITKLIPFTAVSGQSINLRTTWMMDLEMIHGKVLIQETGCFSDGVEHGIFL